MTKKLLIIRNIAHSKYKYQSFGDEELGLLVEFLQDGVEYARILEWLKQPDSPTGGNITSAYNEDGKIVIRIGLWDDDGEYLFSEKYVTTAPQLANIIHQWIALKKINLDAILIEQDDAGDVTMRAVTFDEIEGIINKIDNN